MGKFYPFLTELIACDISVFSFQEVNFSKYQCIFSKLGMCIDIVELCFGIATCMGKFCPFLRSVICRSIYIFTFWTITCAQKVLFCSSKMLLFSNFPLVKLAVSFVVISNNNKFHIGQSF